MSAKFIILEEGAIKSFCYKLKYALLKSSSVSFQIEYYHIKKQSYEQTAHVRAKLNIHVGEKCRKGIKEWCSVDGSHLHQMHRSPNNIGTNEKFFLYQNPAGYKDGVDPLDVFISVFIEFYNRCFTRI